MKDCKRPWQLATANTEVFDAILSLQISPSNVQNDFFPLTTTGYQGKQEPFPDIITAKARGLFSKQLYHVML